MITGSDYTVKSRFQTYDIVTTRNIPMKTEIIGNNKNQNVLFSQSCFLLLFCLCLPWF